MKTYINKAFALPLNEILLNNGYMIDREKHSRNSQAFFNDEDKIGGTIIVSKKEDPQNGEVYLYWNTLHSWDRGNIVNFCKNRNISINDFINNKANLKEATPIQSLNIIGEKEILQIRREFESLAHYDTSHCLLQNRGIYTSTIKSYLHNLKQDQYNNLCIPTYQLLSGESFHNIKQCGYIKRLNIPLYKDAEGNLREKPLKSICRGKKGLEILNPINPSEKNKENFLKLKYVVISESAFDALSYLQMNRIESTEAFLISTAGNFDQNNTEKTIAEILKKINALRTQGNPLAIVIAMDNDTKGKEFSHILEKMIINQTKRMPIIYTPFTKDANDDLRLSQIIGSNDLNCENLEKFLKSSIYKYKMSKSSSERSSILEDLRKIDTLKPLSTAIKEEFNAIHKHKAIKAL